MKPVVQPLRTTTAQFLRSGTHFQMTTNLKALTLLLTLALVVSQLTQPSLAQTTDSPLTGNWNSTLVIGAQTLRLALKVTGAPDGLKAIVDSLDQPNGANLTVDVITFQNNVLHFEMKRLSIVYEGTMNKDGSEIVGTFTQGASTPLIFRKEGTTKSKAPVKRGRVELVPCENPNFTSEILCTKYEVFENRATKTGRRIPLNVILLPSTNQQRPAPDPLFYLAGGPGGAATTYATEKYIQNLRRNRDVVLVDQRGTGESNLLNCPSLGSREDMRPFFGEPFPAERVRACRATLEKVADLTLYTTSIAMDDMDEVREALGYDKINVYGGSYGSTTSLAYLRQHGDHVRSVAIFGVAPPSARIPLSFSRGVQDSMNRLFADCKADPACNAAYPDVSGDFKKVVAQFDNGPVEVTATNVYTRTPQKVTVTRDAFVDGIRQLLYVPAAAAALPYLIHIGAGGDLGPLVGTAFQVVSQISEKIARGMQFSVICAEDAPFITDEDIKTTSANSFYGDARVRPTMKACEEWPKAKVPASFLDPVKSDKPVLLVSGALDPVTPPWLAQEVAKTLPNSKLIVIQNATHSSYDCVENLVADFIDKGTTQGLDTSCTDKIQRPPFAIVK
jgi:pimeloyl-ACP methyl ester carboxylesterase